MVAIGNKSGYLQDYTIVHSVLLYSQKGTALLGQVVQRPDNFIQWISRYPSVSICAKISVFPLVQANMHTLTTVKFGSVRKPWTTFHMKYILDPE